MNLAALRRLPPDLLAEALGQMDERTLRLFTWKLTWFSKARPKQLPPADLDFLIWFIMSGRGFGKTLAGAHWLAEGALTDPFDDVNNLSHVIAATNEDHDKTTFEGPTGLINVIPPDFIVKYTVKPREILLDNGGKILGFTAMEPERLRGPQCKRAWCEEVGSWRYDTATWDMMMLGLRLGKNPQVCVTSTPKPRPLVNALVKHDRCALVRGSTYENEANLAKPFLDELLKYEGTRLGRQELHGELLDLAELGIVQRSSIRLWPSGKPLPEFKFIVMSLDTAFTEKTFNQETLERDPTGCTVWGVFDEVVLVEDRYKWPMRRALPGVMLLDAWQDMLGFPDLVLRVKKELKARYGPPTAPSVHPVFGRPNLATDGKGVDLLLIEDIGSGKSLRQTLELDGIVAYPYNPHNVDKLARLHVASPLFARGRVWMMESPRVARGKAPPGTLVSWAEPVVEQLTTFIGPDTIEHDEFVDTTTQALRVLVDTGELRAVSEEQLRAELARDAERRVTGAPPGEPSRGPLVEDDPGAYSARVSTLRENPYAN